MLRSSASVSLSLYEQELSPRNHRFRGVFVFGCFCGGALVSEGCFCYVVFLLFQGFLVTEVILQKVQTGNAFLRHGPYPDKNRLHPLRVVFAEGTDCNAFFEYSLYLYLFRFLSANIDLTEGTDRKSILALWAVSFPICTLFRIKQ